VAVAKYDHDKKEETDPTEAFGCGGRYEADGYNSTPRFFSPLLFSVVNFVNVIVY
jgi:hypothetical protein